MLILGCFAYSQLDLSWWIFAACFLLPDIGMLGYLVNPKAGAISYNLFHHKGLAVVLWIIGSITGILSLSVAGIILFSHASFDRILGYGLKYSDRFHHTHLGTIGPSKSHEA